MGASATSNIVNEFKVEMSSSVGIYSKYTRFRGMCVPLFMLGGRLVGMNKIAFVCSPWPFHHICCTISIRNLVSNREKALLEAFQSSSLTS